MSDLGEAMSPYTLFFETYGPLNTVGYYSWLLLVAPILLVYYLWLVLLNHRQSYCRIHILRRQEAWIENHAQLRRCLPLHSDKG